ncbi:excalibur calcium-binding domain-containing protein [Frankia sp. EI5c]|uniref:excalibur calcium-binding domain-containing protein n=1 Tax=Frankia sp. EI5c TaxID=683316 RepID=UPI001F5B30E4|nr:excalibur calcium-binding domain-containing protein [Frankia sp. EI5c]
MALIGGCGSASDGAVEAASSPTAGSGQVQVPDVLGLDLNEAKDRLGPDLDAKSVDATGRDRMQIIDSNWQVVQQDPTGGSAVPKGTTVTLHVVKEGESVSPTASPTATATPSGAPPVPQVADSQPPPAPAPAPTTRPADPLPPADNPPPANDNPPADPYYANCDAVRAAGAAPLHRGEPGYRSRLDRDGDGTACDT